MNELEARKQLLLAESAVNRALLDRDWETMVQGAVGIVSEVKQAGKLLGVGAALIGALGIFRRARTPKATAGRSWFRTLFGLARWAVPIWMELRREPR
jgi:hypothetical protein